MTAAALDSDEVAVIWHDVECGAYGADLPLWEELAADVSRGGAAVLDLGAGTGRVALHLARRGHRVCALNHDPMLIEAMREQIADQRVTPLVADARDFELSRRFDLIAAAMQLVHLMSAEGRRSMLSCVARHLAPGGIAAIAIMTATPTTWRAGEQGAAPAPDVGERESWVFSSLPLGIEAGDGAVTIRRLRQIVSPDGDLSEEEHAFALDRLSADDLESEAVTAGLVPRARRTVPETEDYVGSTVVVLEARR